jgi:hypothetical protein
MAARTCRAALHIVDLLDAFANGIDGGLAEQQRQLADHAPDKASSLPCQRLDPCPVLFHEIFGRRDAPPEDQVRKIVPIQPHIS